jgi:hypothetical protein
MTMADVVALANREASRRGYDLTKYEKPRPAYEFTRKDQIWTVFYDGKQKRPSNHFQVWVNDVTGECQLMSGE